MLLTTLSNGDVLQKRQEKLHIYMVSLENLMYRCRYQTDTSVWINCIFFVKENESESCFLELLFLCFVPNRYEAVSEWVTGKVLREDKTHSTGLSMSDPNILVPNEPSWSYLSSHAWCWRQNTSTFGEILKFFDKVVSDHLGWHPYFSK